MAELHLDGLTITYGSGKADSLNIAIAWPDRWRGFTSNPHGFGSQSRRTQDISAVSTRAGRLGPTLTNFWWTDGVAHRLGLKIVLKEHIRRAACHSQRRNPHGYNRKR